MVNEERKKRVKKQPMKRLKRVLYEG